MKCIKNIKLLILSGLLLQVGIGSATEWEPTRPTLKDIQASTKVENLAVKGSQEDKLLSAVKNGDLPLVETLIVACTGLEARDSENMTALMIAVRKGYTDIASTLISAGANINAENRYGWTPLCYAFDKGNTAIVKLLIVHGAAKNEKNLEELFISAVYKGNKEMVNALLTTDITIDADILEEAYMLALNFRNTDIAKAINDYCNNANELE